MRVCLCFGNGNVDSLGTDELVIGACGVEVRILGNIVALLTHDVEEDAFGGDGSAGMAVKFAPLLLADCSPMLLARPFPAPREIVSYWSVKRVGSFVVVEPRLEVVPYITCEVPGVLVDQETVAEVVVMPPAATFEMI